MAATTIYDCFQSILSLRNRVVKDSHLEALNDRKLTFEY